MCGGGGGGGGFRVVKLTPDWFIYDIIQDVTGCGFMTSYMQEKVMNKYIGRRSTPGVPSLVNFDVKSTESLYHETSIDQQVPIL